MLRAAALACTFNLAALAAQFHRRLVFSLLTHNGKRWLSCVEQSTRNQMTDTELLDFIQANEARK